MGKGNATTADVELTGDDGVDGPREWIDTGTKQQRDETVCCIRRLYGQDNVSRSMLRQRAVFGNKDPDVDSRPTERGRDPPGNPG